MNEGVLIVKGDWQQVPGSPLEAAFDKDDPFPSIRLRWNDDLARLWFEKMFDQSFDYIQYSLGLSGEQAV